MKKITFILAAAILSGCSASPKGDARSVGLTNSPIQEESVEVYPIEDSLGQGVEGLEQNVAQERVSDVPNGNYSLESYLTSVNSLSMVDRSVLDDMQVQLLTVVDAEYRDRYELLARDYKEEMQSHLDTKAEYEFPTFFLPEIQSVEVLLDNSEQLSEYDKKELKLNLELLRAKQMDVELEDRYEFEVQFLRKKSNLRYSFQQSKFDLELNHKREISQILMEGEMSQYYGDKLEAARLNIVALEAAIESLEADAYGWGDDETVVEADGAILNVEDDTLDEEVVLDKGLL